MNGTNLNDRGTAALLGVLLALGLIIGGWILGVEIKATRLSDRYVTVKGLVERKVMERRSPTRKQFWNFWISKVFSLLKLNWASSTSSTRRLTNMEQVTAHPAATSSSNK
jgi:hypothetical protein